MYLIDSTQHYVCEIYLIIYYSYRLLFFLTFFSPIILNNFKLKENLQLNNIKNFFPQSFKNNLLVGFPINLEDIYGAFPTHKSILLCNLHTTIKNRKLLLMHCYQEGSMKSFPLSQ